MAADELIEMAPNERKNAPGYEAEELRAGIEAILRHVDFAALDCREGQEVELALRLLLDRVDARDSLKVVEERAQMLTAIAGLEGEAAGHKVTAAFFQTRCEVLERAMQDKFTTITRERAALDQAAMRGCCPLCAVTPAEIQDELTRNLQQRHDRMAEKFEPLAAECTTMRPVYQAFRKFAIGNVDGLSELISLAAIFRTEEGRTS